MEKIITHEEFMKGNTSELFDPYFLQFANVLTYQVVRNRFDVSLLLRMYAENGNFNNPGPVNGIIRPSLSAWDKLCLPSFFNTKRMKEAGEICTMTTMVCTLKRVAKKIVLQTVRENVNEIATTNRHLILQGEEITAEEFAKRIKNSANYGQQSFKNTQADVITIYGGYWASEPKNVVHLWDSSITSEIG